MVVPKRGIEIRPDALSLGDAVFQRLSEAMLDGTLTQGELLRVDELRRWLGVSRTPIREALAKLATLGMVETQPGRFTRVARVDSQLAGDTLAYIGFHGGVAFRLAAERMTDVQVDAALILLERMVSASDAGAAQAHLEASRRLVDLVADIAGNRILRRVADELNLMGEWNLRDQQGMPGTKAQRHANHVQLRDAITNRDPSCAEFAFRALYQFDYAPGYARPAAGAAS